MTNWQRRKVLSHLGLRSNVLLRLLTDLGNLVGSVLQAHSMVSNIKFDILISFLEGPYKYPMNNWQRTAKFFLSCGLCQRYFPGH
jgi:hypothetical protein